MVKGAWWHSAHFFFSFQVRLSFARKVRPRWIAPLTSGAGSAARAPNGSETKVTAAGRNRMADLLFGVARVEEEGVGRQRGYSNRPATGMPEAAAAGLALRQTTLWHLPS